MGDFVFFLFFLNLISRTIQSCDFQIVVFDACVGISKKKIGLINTMYCIHVLISTILMRIHKKNMHK